MTKKKEQKPAAPRELGPEGRQLWVELVVEYEIEDAGGLAILRLACESWQRYKDAQRQIKADGMSFLDRFDQVRAHPLLAIERDSRAQCLQALKSLNLGIEPLRDGPGRPGGR